MQFQRDYIILSDFYPKEICVTSKTNGEKLKNGMNSGPAETKLDTITLDGEARTFTAGESIYDVARRHGTNIPTLCYDPRLEAFGGCRLCIVALEGTRNPVASCTTMATPGMVVRTATEEIEKHRRVLLEMVVSENRETEGQFTARLCVTRAYDACRTLRGGHWALRGKTIRHKQQRPTKIHLLCVITTSVSPATGVCEFVRNRREITPLV